MKFKTFLAELQMQSGMAAAVVEATAETHYSYQQQTSRQLSPHEQSAEASSQIGEQQATHIQVQNQVLNHGQQLQQQQQQQHITTQRQQLQQINNSAQQITNEQQQGQTQQQHITQQQIQVECCNYNKL